MSWVHALSILPSVSHLTYAAGMVRAEQVRGAPAQRAQATIAVSATQATDRLGFPHVHYKHTYCSDQFAIFWSVPAMPS